VLLSPDIIKSVHEFFRRKRCGPKFTNDYASRRIAEECRVRQLRACGSGQGKDAQNRVAGAGHIEDLATGGAAVDSGLAYASVSDFKSGCRNMQSARRGFFD